MLDANYNKDISEETPRVIRSSAHLGRIYRFYPMEMKIGVTDGEKRGCFSKIVECVEDWNHLDRNPYRIASPDREGFLGRDIMLELLVKITLDPETRESVWELL